MIPAGLRRWAADWRWWVWNTAFPWWIGRAAPVIWESLLLVGISTAALMATVVLGYLVLVLLVLFGILTIPGILR